MYSNQNSSNPGTPTSQNPSQNSESLSPLELNFGTPASNGTASSIATPANREQLPLERVPIPSPNVSNREPGNEAMQQQALSDSKMFTNGASQFRDGNNQIILTNTAVPVAKLDDNLPPAFVPVRHNSTDSSSGVSDSGRAKTDQSENTRTRTTDSAKVRHNIVERRYRENINSQVDVLRDSIVATMQVKDEQNGTSSSRLGADELKRLTKAAVIAAATQQIKRARSENDKLLDEHRTLQAQIKELEKQVKCGECPLMTLSIDMGLESSPQQA